MVSLICYKHFVPIGTDKGGYQKAFFTAYLFLWEGSPEPDFIGVWRRLLQGRREHGLCEIAIFGAKSGQEIENSLQGSFRIWV